MWFCLVLLLLFDCLLFVSVGWLDRCVLTVLLCIGVCLLTFCLTACYLLVTVVSDLLLIVLI